MFSWINKDDQRKREPEVYASVGEGLKKLYHQKLLPLEEYYKFHDFHSPPLDDPDFDAKPMVLLIGQYSTGKTTFIRYLLEQDFPGLRIGPEPTTDRFIAVMHGDQEAVIPGNALVVDPKKPFRPLSKFGNAFLNRFQCSQVRNKVLESISILDTPGILSGEKQRVDRGYDFTEVVAWMAERVDRIILLFDAHKLDISDEFRRTIHSMRGFDEKIRIVLNKADMVDHQQLMRVYGALMWSLGKVFNTPEVARVYIGSFWDQPLHFDMNRRLFELEEQDLFSDIQSLPRNAILRKLNDLIKRARLAKVHAYIMSHLKKEMPSMFGKESKKKELIAGLGDIFASLQRQHQISAGDFPNVEKMQEQLQYHDFTKFPLLKPKLLETVDRMLAEDIARLMTMIPKEDQQKQDTAVVKEARRRSSDDDGSEEPVAKKGRFLDFLSGWFSPPPVQQPPPAPQSDLKVQGGAFDGYNESPFGIGKGEGVDRRGDHADEWVVSTDRYKYDEIFERLGPVDGKITGASAKSELVKSRLPNSILGKVWKLSDIDRDGMLDADEFALAMHLINIKLDGYDLPNDLPPHLVPPSKRFM